MFALEIIAEEKNGGWGSAQHREDSYKTSSPLFKSQI